MSGGLTQVTPLSTPEGEGRGWKRKSREFEGGKTCLLTREQERCPHGAGQHLPGSPLSCAVGEVEMTWRDANCPRGNVLLPHPAALPSLARHHSRPRYAQAFPPFISLGSPSSLAPLSPSAGETEARSGGAAPPPCQRAQLETPGKTRGEQIQVTSSVCDLMMESCVCALAATAEPSVSTLCPHVTPPTAALPAPALEIPLSCWQSTAQVLLRGVY